MARTQFISPTGVVAGAIVTADIAVEADNYPAGTILDTVVPGVTLSVVGETTSVIALTGGLPSTGTRLFGHGSEDVWYSVLFWLRADFAVPVSAASIDVIGDDESDPGILQAFGADGVLLQELTTDGGTPGVPRTMTISRPQADIAFIRASGLDFDTVHLDNLRISGGRIDVYSVAAAAGDFLDIRTTTPGDGPGEPINLLDPRIELSNGSGVLVASDDNSGGDGRNARISYPVPAGGSGVYSVRVLGLNTGEYTLTVGGAAAAPGPAPFVTATAPVAGRILTAPPTTIEATFSEPLRIDSIAAADLVIDGGAAVTGVTVLDARSLRFDIALPNVEGTYTYSLPAGALTDLQGLGSSAFSGSFQVDRTGPRVVAHVPRAACLVAVHRDRLHVRRRDRRRQLHVRRRRQLHRPRRRRPAEPDHRRDRVGPDLHGPLQRPDGAGHVHPGHRPRHHRRGGQPDGPGPRRHPRRGRRHLHRLDRPGIGRPASHRPRRRPRRAAVRRIGHHHLAGQEHGKRGDGRRRVDRPGHGRQHAHGPDAGQHRRRLLGRRLDAEGTASRQHTFTLPRGDTGVGTLSVTVTTDSGNAVVERNAAGTGEVNNAANITRAATLTPSADLATSSVTLTGTSGLTFAGDLLAVTWAVNNVGPGTTGDGTPGSSVTAWTDRLVLSVDATVGNADDILLGDIAHAGASSRARATPAPGRVESPPGPRGSTTSSSRPTTGAGSAPSSRTTTPAPTSRASRTPSTSPRPRSRTSPRRSPSRRVRARSARRST